MKPHETSPNQRSYREKIRQEGGLNKHFGVKKNSKLGYALDILNNTGIRNTNDKETMNTAEKMVKKGYSIKALRTLSHLTEEFKNKYPREDEERAKTRENVKMPNWDKYQGKNKTYIFNFLENSYHTNRYDYSLHKILRGMSGEKEKKKFISQEYKNLRERLTKMTGSSYSDYEMLSHKVSSGTQKQYESFTNKLFGMKVIREALEAAMEYETNSENKIGARNFFSDLKEFVYPETEMELTGFTFTNFKYDVLEKLKTDITNMMYKVDGLDYDVYYKLNEAAQVLDEMMRKEMSKSDRRRKTRK